MKHQPSVLARSWGDAELANCQSNALKPSAMTVVRCQAKRSVLRVNSVLPKSFGKSRRKRGLSEFLCVRRFFDLPSCCSARREGEAVFVQYRELVHC